jgi:hypothetical protein
LAEAGVPLARYYLDRLQQLGVSQRGVQMERDGWILVQSVAPEQAAIRIADKRRCDQRSGVPRFLPRIRRGVRLVPYDPRRYTLADRAQRWLADRSGRGEVGKRPVPDPTIARLVATSTMSSPAWDRLTEIAKQRLAG